MPSNFLMKDVSVLFNPEELFKLDTNSVLNLTVILTSCAWLYLVKEYPNESHRIGAGMSLFLFLILLYYVSNINSNSIEVPREDFIYKKQPELAFDY